MADNGGSYSRVLLAVAGGTVVAGFLLLRLRLRYVDRQSHKADVTTVLYPHEKHKGTIVALHGPLQNGRDLAAMLDRYHPELRQQFKLVCPSARFRPVPGQLLPWTVRCVVWAMVQLGMVESRNGRLRQWYSEIIQDGRKGNEFTRETYSTDVLPFSEDDLADPEELNAHVARLLPLVEQEILHLGGNAERLFVLGYSSGGMVALRLGLACHKRLGGIVVLASFHAQPSLVLGKGADSFIHEDNDRKVPIMAYAGANDLLVPTALTEASIGHLAGECRCSNVKIDVMAEHSHRSILNHSHRFSQWLLQRLALLDYLTSTGSEPEHDGQLPLC